jgi:hypothetical protein
MPKFSKKIKIPREISMSLGGYLGNTFSKPVLIGDSRRLKVDGVF